MARRYREQKLKRPLIVICSEGGKKSTEYYYFGNYSNRYLRIQFSTGNSTDPKGMLDDLLNYINNEDLKNEDNVKIFILLDTDLNEKRINEIKEIEQKCKENNIEIITSSPTFEIWYLMHYRNKELIFNSSKEVKKELKEILGKYKEATNIFNKIDDRREFAYKTAKTIDKQNNGDILNINPHSSIYKIIDTINDFNSKTSK